MECTVNERLIAFTFFGVFMKAFENEIFFGEGVREGFGGMEECE